MPALNYRGRKVFVTGHTGFKGSWLSYWLTREGAEVCGYSLPPPTEPSHWNLLRLPMRSEIGDIRDGERLDRVVRSFQPEVLFHLAAQPLVRRSYQIPEETFEVNVMGTVRVLEACRRCDSIRAIVVVTSDKCYENKEWVWGYRETDPLGGGDPYSASKACAEHVVTSYRYAFFDAGQYQRSHQVLLASCRAGNVVGGGDWAEDRLFPDVVRAAADDRAVTIRNPDAVRPWQHVLDPVRGYLQLGLKLLAGETSAAQAWNFGPEREDSVTVLEAVRLFQSLWPRVRYEVRRDCGPREAGLLRLDVSKAAQLLGWRPTWSLDKALYWTVTWYRDYYENGRIDTEQCLREYISDTRGLGDSTF